MLPHWSTMKPWLKVMEAMKWTVPFVIRKIRAFPTRNKSFHHPFDVIIWNSAFLENAILMATWENAAMVIWTFLYWFNNRYFLVCFLKKLESMMNTKTGCMMCENDVLAVHNTECWVKTLFIIINVVRAYSINNILILSSF